MSLKDFNEQMRKKDSLEKDLSEFLTDYYYPPTPDDLVAAITRLKAIFQKHCNNQAQSKIDYVHEQLHPTETVLVAPNAKVGKIWRKEYPGIKVYTQRYVPTYKLPKEYK